MGLADGFEQIEAFAIRESEVEKQDVGFMFRDHLQALAPGKGGGGGVTAPLQDRGQGGLDVAFVVDDTDQGLGTHCT